MFSVDILIFSDEMVIKYFVKSKKKIREPVRLGSCSFESNLLNGNEIHVYAFQINPVFFLPSFAEDI